MALGEIDGGDVELTARDLLLRRADAAADEAIEKAANERKSGSEARKLASEARARVMRGGVGGGSGAGVDVEGLPQRIRPGAKKMAKGGKVKKYSIDGIAKRGKTRAR